ncbi:hypothetical protein DdX_21271 [Ditylenchus destructor]|uniref:Uncharacterized protein n=1 Tax=Ditylenchus destructor TaxID=166010 RepID=A0AAD4MF39_9BILA|nr:hypothetical protein DdX_21271 [Ditylenchus destructor]
MLHKIDSEIGQIRQKIDSLANEEKSEESYTRKYNSCIIVAEFILSVIAMFLIWERRRARNREHLDGIQNDAEMQNNAGNMNHDEENLLG